MCYTVLHMKISKTFRLSEEAVKVLNEKENATQFLEDIILDTPTPKNLEVVSLQQLEVLLDEKIKRLATPKRGAVGHVFGVPVDEVKRSHELLMSAEVPTEDRVAVVNEFEGATEAGLPSLQECCKGKSPCKHWSWDGDKVGYINSITGEVREV